MVNAGVVGFKCFLINSGVSEFPYVNEDDLDKAFLHLNGTGTVLAVSMVQLIIHCHAIYTKQPLNITYAEWYLQFHAEVQIDNKDADCEGLSCPGN